VDPAFPDRQDKARRFGELMADAKGASRATYFRLRKRLEAEKRLVVQIVPSICLRRTRRPGIPTQLELDAMQEQQPEVGEEESRLLDVPARDTFARPIRGEGGALTIPQRPVLDDTVSWERPEKDEEDEG